MKLDRQILLGALVLSALAGSCASKPEAAAAAKAPAPVVREPLSAGLEKSWPDGTRLWVLPTGQTVIVKPIPGSPNVTINTWVRVGSADETEEINGVSHFLEHLLFKGTAKYGPRDLDAAFEGMGSDINASTSDDFTNFHVTAQAADFEKVLEIHADMMQHALLPEHELDQERKVVIEEINRANDSPMRKLFLALNGLAYRQHPYRLDTLGPASNIATIPREKIVAYYENHYALKNLITVVAGGVDPQQTRQLVEKQFQTGRKGGAEPFKADPEPWPTAERRTDERMDLSKAYVAVAWRGPAAANMEDAVDLDAAAVVAGQGASSRLYQRLVQREQVALSVQSFSQNQRDDGMFGVLAVCDPENAGIVEAAIKEEIARLRSENISTTEFRKVIEKARREFIFDSETSDGMAFALGWYATASKIENFFGYLPALERTTPERIRNTVAAYLRPERTMVARVLPEAFDVASLKAAPATASSKPAAVPAAAPAEAQPEAQPLPPAQKFETKEYRLKLGGTLIVRSNPANDVLAIRVMFKGGDRLQPKAGLSDLLARVLTKGAGSRDAAEFAAYVEENGLQIQATSEPDYLEITGRGIGADFERILSLLGDIVYRPTLTQDDIDRERRLILKSITSSRDRPEAYVTEKLLLALYHEHGYGDVGERVEKELPGITRKDVIEFYKAQLNPAAMVVAVVGNVEAARVRDRMDETFSLERHGAGEGYQTLLTAARKPVKPPKADVTVKTPRPTEQTHLIRAYLGVPVMHPDYPALKVLSSLLGQGLSSRLFVELRDKRGLAYTTSASFPHGLDPTGFQLYIATDPKNTDAVIQGFDEQIRRLMNEPVSKEETAFARDKFTGKFQLAHETNLEQSFYLGYYELAGFGWDYDNQFPKKIQAVTPADLTRVAKKYFSRPSVTSLLGPPAAIGSKPKP